MNCRSLPTKCENIKIFLSTLTYQPLVIALSETWLTESQESYYNISGYSLVSRPRLGKRGGEVGFYLSNNTQYNTILHTIHNIQYWYYVFNFARSRQSMTTNNTIKYRVQKKKKKSMCNQSLKLSAIELNDFEITPLILVTVQCS